MNKNRRGAYITIDGPDGVGKTTQTQRLAENTNSVWVREPGGTPVGDSIRSLVKFSEYDMNERTELLLFMASRSELSDHIRKCMLLETPRSVVSDRSIASTIGYQVHGRKLQFTHQQVLDIGSFAMNGLLPDMRVFLDIPIDVMRSRIDNRGEETDRFEREDHQFHNRVREGLLIFAREIGGIVVDASGTREEVEAELLAICGPLLSDGVKV